MEQTDQLDLIACLPKELQHRMFVSLDIQSLLRSERVGKVWNCLIDNYVWKIKCKENNFLEVEQNRYGYNKCCKKHIYWKGIFLYHHTLRKNWLMKPFTKYLMEEKGKQMLNCNDANIIEVSVSGAIYIINAYGKMFRSIQGNGKSVIFAKIQDEHLLSLNEDKQLVLWKVDSAKSVWNIECSKEYNIAADFSQGTIACNSKLKNFVNLMNVTAKKVRFRLKHPSQVSRIYFYKEKLICACEDGQIHVWYHKNGKLIYILDDYEDPDIIDLAANGIYAASRSTNNYIVVWNVDTGETLHKFRGTSIKFLDEETLLFVEKNNKFLTVIDCKSGKCLTRIDNEEEVQKITTNNKFIFTKSASFIKMYNLINRKLERTDTTLCMRFKVVSFFEASDTKLAITFREDQKLTSIILDFDVETCK